MTKKVDRNNQIQDEVNKNRKRAINQSTKQTNKESMIKGINL